MIYKLSDIKELYKTYMYVWLVSAANVGVWRGCSRWQPSQVHSSSKHLSEYHANGQNGSINESK